MRSLRVALVAALFGLAVAAPAAAADTVVIDAADPSGQSSQFQPPNVTVNAGDTVRWEFDQAATTHTVTSSSANWSLDQTRAPNGEPVTFTFTQPGTYTFLCKIHNGMTGWSRSARATRCSACSCSPRPPASGTTRSRIVTPGNYGWPYCIRDNVPYNDYDFATNTSGPKFNCTNLTNTSPNNTDLTNLPPGRPATMWMATRRTDPRHPGLGTGGAPTGGPRYRFDAALDSDTKFPQYYDGQWFIGEWNNGWIKTAKLNAAGTDVTAVNDTPWTHTFARPHEMDSGPTPLAVTVTDRGGKSAMQTVAISVGDPAGNRAPRVEGAAAPRSGKAPLAVSLSAAVNDPDGDPTSVVWDFGDGGHAGGTSVTHTFTAAGSDTATVTATDPGGKSGSATVQVVVTAPQGAPRPAAPAVGKVTVGRVTAGTPGRSRLAA